MRGGKIQADVQRDYLEHTGVSLEELFFDVTEGE